MTLQDLGFTPDLEQHRKDHGLDSFEIGRVSLEHKERYIIKSTDQEFDAELIGNLRFNAQSRSDFPAVGDWVAFSEFDDGKAIIHAIYPRHSIIERKAAGRSSQAQIIATNVDHGLIVQAVDRDFNLNRLERYLTVCYSANVNPIIVLSKIDMITKEELISILDQVKSRVSDVHVVAVSHDEGGYDDLSQHIDSGKTYCLLGSSGVGKSTMLNKLSGGELMKTGEISTAVNKGKHVTSHRELVILNNGAILIDNPGMREVGIADLSEGVETTFDDILAYAEDCRYKDCTHMHESGCAVLEAVENEDIDESAFTNYLKLQKEKMHYESDAQDRKKKDKELGKLIKDVKKQRKRNKY
jgi:ribosome biogenesis GTPase